MPGLGSRVWTAVAVLWLAAALPTQQAEPERPWLRPATGRELVWQRGPGLDATSWRALHAVRLRAVDGEIEVTATGADPYFLAPPAPGSVPSPAPSGELVVVVEGSFALAGDHLDCYWTTAAEPEMSPVRFATVRVPRGAGRVELRLGEVDELRALRFDPGDGEGSMRLWRVAVVAQRRAERWVTGAEVAAGEDGAPPSVFLTMHNDGREIPAAEPRLLPGALTALPVEARWRGGFAEIDLEQLGGLAAAGRVALHVHDLASLLEQAPDRPGLALRVWPEQSAAVVYRDRRPVVVLHPLVLRHGRRVPLRTAAESEPDAVRLVSGDVVTTLRLDLTAERLSLEMIAAAGITGPVIRSVDAHRRAVLPGYEYLSRGEPSSSSLDVRTAARWRFVPPNRGLTWPAALVETAAGTMAVRWRDPGREVCFAAPDVYDGLPGTRIELRSNPVPSQRPRPERLELDIDLGAQGLDDAIQRAVRAMDLPRSAALDEDLATWRQRCDDALSGPLRNADGFGHCAEPRWERRPHADLLSAWWRLRGSLPEPLPGDGRLAPGGAHLRDHLSWFAAGQAERLVEQVRGRARGLLAAQRDDGSWGYAGEYRDRHFDDVSSGQIGLACSQLLNWASWSGDRTALEAALRGLRALERRCDAPRGAQLWELALHTPDILAAAHLVTAHVLAFEQTGDATHLERARTWAARGLPFVYLRGDLPDASYATIAVFGATNWQAPVWFGLPVQWCGLVYADALARLAPHDDALDWRAIAAGILARGKAMQYADGPLRGCLPDFFHLDTGRGGGPSINPGALLSLDLRLRGEPVDLVVTERGGGRFLGPAVPGIEPLRLR